MLKSTAQLRGVYVVASRMAHTDVEFPNFDKYRLKSTLDPHKSARDTEDARRGVSSVILYGVGGALSLWAAKNAVQTAIIYKSMPAERAALASIEINLDEVPEGKTKIYEWREMPVFVRHRTQAQIEKERAVNVSQLRDPEPDEKRVKKPEWSILIGVCTHLGCIPIAGKGDFDGYFCPCHGSHYDGSGRIRKGPAPRNLDIPDYEFKTDNIVVVGKDDR